MLTRKPKARLDPTEPQPPPQPAPLPNHHHHYMQLNFTQLSVQISILANVLNDRPPEPILKHPWRNRPS